MEVFRLKNVSKSYSKVPAIHNISLEILMGETVAFIGPSGCGKTTLLRCLALFEQIDTGSIFWRGQPIITADIDGPPKIHVDVNKYRSRVGMVFQNLNLWPHLSVLDNLTLAARTVLRENKHTSKDRAMHLLDTMGVAGKAREHPPNLSGGQQQRVALARALMLDPEVLLLDEITSALDPELVGDVLAVIAGLAAKGITMVLVTHEMSFASEVSNRIVFLADGVIVEEGEPDKVLRAPETDRLKSFLARMNRREYRGLQ